MRQKKAGHDERKQMKISWCLSFNIWPEKVKQINNDNKSISFSDAWPHRMLGTGFYVWNALLAQSTRDSRITHAWAAGRTSAPASKAIWKRTFHVLCMIRKLKTSGHSGLTFRYRQEGSCPGTQSFARSALAFHKQHPSLWGKGFMGPRIHGAKGMWNPAVPSPILTKCLPFWGPLQTLSQGQGQQTLPVGW